MSSTAYKQVLVSGIMQIIIGGFCVIFGIIERITALRYNFTAIVGLPIWMGLWICITGILGVISKLRGSSKALIGVYMGFSIVSVVFAANMIICYSLVIAFSYGRSYYSRHYSDTTPLAMGVLILILSIIEFGVGIWSSVCCCVIGPCCGRQQQMAPTGQAMYMQPQGGPAVSYVIVQGPDGTPVAVPAQSGGPMMVPSGTPVNVQGGAVPPHYETAAQSQQMFLPHQNEVKVAL